MIALVRSEVLKLRTTNVWWGMALGLVGFTALALLFNYFTTNALLDDPTFGAPPPEDPSQVQQNQQAAATAVANSAAALATNVYTSGQYFGLLLAMVLGVLIVTNEFFHQTATATFLTTPKRSRVIGAKLVTAALWGALFCLVTAVLAVPIGALLLGSLGTPTELGNGAVLGGLALNLLAFAIWTIFGVGLGTLLKNQIVSIIVVIVAYLGQAVVGTILTVLAIQFDAQWLVDVQYWLPGGASQVMVSTTEVPGIPPWWAGALTLLGYGAVTAAIGTAITVRRDIS